MEAAVRPRRSMQSGHQGLGMGDTVGKRQLQSGAYPNLALCHQAWQRTFLPFSGRAWLANRVNSDLERD